MGDSKHYLDYPHGTYSRASEREKATPAAVWCLSLSLANLPLVVVGTFSGNPLLGIPCSIAAIVAAVIASRKRPTVPRLVVMAFVLNAVAWFICLSIQPRQF